MRLFVRKLTSRHRRKVGLRDERSSRRQAQSLQLDRVSGQACAHLGQSCSIRARNHARRWPPGPKFRQARLPPLLHDVLAPSHPVRGCEPHQQRLCLACHGRQADHQWRAYLASFLLPNVHTTHDPTVLIHWQLHANTALCSCVCGVCCSVCIPFVTAIRQQLQVLEKRSNSSNATEKSKFSLALRGREEGPCGPQRRAKKRALFSEKMRSRVMVTFRR